jgi:hypothetical protein
MGLVNKFGGSQVGSTSILLKCKDKDGREENRVKMDNQQRLPAPSSASNPFIDSDCKANKKLNMKKIVLIQLRSHRTFVYC